MDEAMDAVRNEDEGSLSAINKLLTMVAVREVPPTSGVHLTRTAEDVCDACVRIDIQLARSDLPIEEREHLLLEKSIHLQATIDQRQFMPGFVNQHITAHASLKQSVPDARIADTIDDAPPGPIDDAFPVVQIQIEDFSGSFALPYYGHQRPSTDYFNSILMIQNLITAYVNSQ